MIVFLIERMYKDIEREKRIKGLMMLGASLLICTLIFLKLLEMI